MVSAGAGDVIEAALSAFSKFDFEVFANFIEWADDGTPLCFGKEGVEATRKEEVLTSARDFVLVLGDAESDSHVLDKVGCLEAVKVGFANEAGAVQALRGSFDLLLLRDAPLGPLHRLLLHILNRDV